MRCKPSCGSAWGSLTASFARPYAQASPGQPCLRVVQRQFVRAPLRDQQHLPGQHRKASPVPGVFRSPLDQAIHMGLQYNLGLVLSGRSGRQPARSACRPAAIAAHRERSAKEVAQQTNLQAEGLTIPGFPAVIGPYGYTDIRASAQWSLVEFVVAATITWPLSTTSRAQSSRSRMPRTWWC